MNAWNNLFNEKNIPKTYYILKIDRHVYIIIYANLELKTKCLYKNKWKQNPGGCTGRYLVSD